MAAIVKTLGTVAIMILGGCAVAYPQHAAIFTGIAGAMAGWLHVPQPGAKK